MQAIRVCLETVTPLFLAGADPRGEPELRATSIRGALRFWLRALLGGVLGDQNLDELRKAESSVFGNTSDIGASPVVRRKMAAAGIANDVRESSHRRFCIEAYYLHPRDILCRRAGGVEEPVDAIR